MPSSPAVTSRNKHSEKPYSKKSNGSAGVKSFGGGEVGRQEKRGDGATLLVGVKQKEKEKQGMAVSEPVGNINGKEKEILPEKGKGKAKLDGAGAGVGGGGSTTSFKKVNAKQPINSIPTTTPIPANKNSAKSKPKSKAQVTDIEMSEPIEEEQKKESFHRMRITSNGKMKPYIQFGLKHLFENSTIPLLLTTLPPPSTTHSDPSTSTNTNKTKSSKAPKIPTHAHAHAHHPNPNPNTQTQSLPQSLLSTPKLISVTEILKRNYLSMELEVVEKRNREIGAREGNKIKIKNKKVGVEGDKAVGGEGEGGVNVEKAGDKGKEKAKEVDMDMGMGMEIDDPSIPMSVKKKKEIAHGLYQYTISGSLPPPPQDLSITVSSRRVVGAGTGAGDKEVSPVAQAGAVEEMDVDGVDGDAGVATDGQSKEDQVLKQMLEGGKTSLKMRHIPYMSITLSAFPLTDSQMEEMGLLLNGRKVICQRIQPLQKPKKVRSRKKKGSAKGGFEEKGDDDEMGEGGEELVET